MRCCNCLLFLLVDRGEGRSKQSAKPMDGKQTARQVHASVRLMATTTTAV